MTKINVNGKDRELKDVPGETPLLWVLRDHLGLTGTKYGCGISECGACTVHIDGKPVRDTRDVQTFLAGDSIGKTAAASILRGGERREIALTVGERGQ